MSMFQSPPGRGQGDQSSSSSQPNGASSSLARRVRSQSAVDASLKNPARERFHVFDAYTGKQYSVNVKPDESIDNIKKLLVSHGHCPIPATQQIFLLENGSKVESFKRLNAFSENFERKERIFLFDRKLLNADIHRNPPPVTLPNLSPTSVPEPPMQVNTSNLSPLEAALTVYQQKFLYHVDVVVSYRETFTTRKKLCKICFGEYERQLCALTAVTKNLEQDVKSLDKAHREFYSYYNEVSASHQSLLEGFSADLERLRSVPVNPALQQPGVPPRKFLIEYVQEHRFRTWKDDLEKKHTNLSNKVEVSRRVLADILDAVDEEIKSKVEVNAPLLMGKLDEISEAVGKVEKTFEFVNASYREVVEKVEDLRSEKSGASGSASWRMCDTFQENFDLHEKSIEQLRALDESTIDIILFFFKAKESVAQQLLLKLNKTAELQSRAMTVHKDLKLFEEALPKEKADFLPLLYIRNLPTSCTETVKEVVRRKKWKVFFTKLVEEAHEHIRVTLNDELLLRKKFHRQFGQFLLREFVTALSQPLPTFDVLGLLKQVDALLPDVDIPEDDLRSSCESHYKSLMAEVGESSNGVGLSQGMVGPLLENFAREIYPDMEDLHIRTQTDLDEALATLSERAFQVASEKHKLETELEEQESKVSILTKEVERLRAENEDSVASSKRVVEESIGALENQLKNLQGEKEKLKEELNVSRRRTVEAEAVADEAKKELLAAKATLKAEDAHHQESILKLKGVEARLREELSRFESEQVALRTRLQQQEEDLRMSISSSQNLEGAKEEQEKKILALEKLHEKDRKELQSELDSLLVVFQKKDAAIAEGEAALAASMQKVKDVEKVRVAMDKELKTTKLELEKANQEVQALRTELKRAEEQSASASSSSVRGLDRFLEEIGDVLGMGLMDREGVIGAVSLLRQSTAEMQERNEELMERAGVLQKQWLREKRQLIVERDEAKKAGAESMNSLADAQAGLAAATAELAKAEQEVKKLYEELDLERVAKLECTEERDLLRMRNEELLENLQGLEGGDAGSSGSSSSSSGADARYTLRIGDKVEFSDLVLFIPRPGDGDHYVAVTTQSADTPLGTYVLDAQCKDNFKEEIKNNQPVFGHVVLIEPGKPSEASQYGLSKGAFFIKLTVSKA